jgi:hypothetical protein
MFVAVPAHPSTLRWCAVVCRCVELAQTHRCSFAYSLFNRDGMAHYPLIEDTFGASMHIYLGTCRIGDKIKRKIYSFKISTLFFCTYVFLFVTVFSFLPPLPPKKLHVFSNLYNYTEWQRKYFTHY